MDTLPEALGKGFFFLGPHNLRFTIRLLLSLALSLLSPCMRHYLPVIIF